MNIILNGRRLLEMSGLPNANQLALRSQISYPTIVRYLEKDDVSIIDMRILAAILARGCRMTKEQIADMRIGDLFEVTDEN